MQTSICVIGVGYVGLPLAVAFDEYGHDVGAYDVSDTKITQLQGGTDPTGDLGDERIADSTINFTQDPSAIEDASFVIVAVPTPIDDLKNPDLENVERSGEMIGRYIQDGTTVVLESTVYPGATREILMPAIERSSHLTAGEEFVVGYSPERLVPGDDEHGLTDVVKIISGQSYEVATELEALYGSIIDAGVHRAPTIEAAEAAKCLENIQRDLNIALINELAVTCNVIGLDTHAVLDAARTKWNFHEYQPGLVGGHCIPVDPFFIIYESERNGFTPQLIEKAREVNEYLPRHVGEVTLRTLSNNHKPFTESTVLLLGLAYKPNVDDIRQSAVGGIIEKLSSFNVEVVGFDPKVDPEASRKQFDIAIQETLSFEEIDAIVLATPHDELLQIEYTDVAREMAPDPALIDIVGSLDAERLENDDALIYERI